MHDVVKPERLTRQRQPRAEGPWRLKGELHHPKDKACNFEITPEFERFNQANDIYTRGQWDERLRSEKVLNWFKGMFRTGIGVKKSEGYTMRDFALRNAGWMGANLTIQRGLPQGRVDGFLDYIMPYSAPNAEKIAVDSPETMAEEIKQVARLFGADGVGITHTDKRWHYTNSFSTKTLAEKPYDIPEDLQNTIVIITSMHYEAVKSYPSATAGVAVGHGYSKDCELVQSIATYILNLGFRAVACVNDTSNAIPYAIAAGLGEYGRNGLLITKDFGPRVRIGRIHTDLPLAHDQPISFGVKRFCESTCRRCAQECPPQAISHGAPTVEVPNQSLIKGVKKWQVDPEKCFKFWTNQGTECGVCIRVCPYNKDISTFRSRGYFRLFQAMAASSLAPVRRLALWLDVKLGYGKRIKPNQYWLKFRSK
jgi:epoxyqueuosine reductase QueG